MAKLHTSRLHTTRRGLLSAAGATGLLLAARRPARAADEIVVGATVPITGPLAASGLQYYDSLQLAQDDINAAGGINGRKLRIAFEDTQASNSIAVNAFIKLAQQYDPPFIFLSSYTIQNLAVEPQVAKAQIPTVYAGGAVAITDRKNPWMFRIRPPDSLGGKAIGSALTDRLKVKNVGIIHVQDDYGTASANAIAAVVTAAGGTIVAMESYNARDNDFSAQLLSIKNKGSQAFVAVSYVRDGALVATQRRNLGLDIPMIGSTSFVVPSLLDLVTPDDLKNTYSMIDAILGAPMGPKSVDYMQRFDARFGMRADPFGSCYYDAAMILADAMRKVGTDKTKIRDYFAGVKGDKGVTRIWTTDSLGDMAHSVALVDFVPGTKDMKLVSYYPPAA
jgi:branched-chain amino acid transport system substrate-binding protein